jgi:hypothetical protein
MIVPKALVEQNSILKRWLHVSALYKAIVRPPNKFNRLGCILEMFALYGIQYGIK